MDKETKMMFNSVLEEMAKMEERINERFDTMERRFEKMENHIELLMLQGLSLNLTYYFS